MNIVITAIWQVFHPNVNWDKPGIPKLQYVSQEARKIICKLPFEAM